MAEHAWTLALILATAVGSVAVLGQLLTQRGQHRLEEARAHWWQADAWKNLQVDWSRCMAICSPSPVDENELRNLVEDHRQAQIAWLSDQDRADLQKLFDRRQHASDALEPYFQSVQRVVTHLSQLAGLVLRRRVSIASLYDAIGYDLIHIGDSIRSLVSLPYGYGTGCVAPTNEERWYWSSADLNTVMQRVGWGRFLAPSRGPAERVLLLQQLLVAYAVKVGDLEVTVEPYSETHAMAENLVLPRRLGVYYRAARAHSRRRALSLTLTLARAGRRARRRYEYNYRAYYPRLWRLAERLYPQGPPNPREQTFRWLTYQIFVRGVALVVDQIALVADVVRAHLASSNVLDVRFLDPPPELLPADQRAKYRRWSYWFTQDRHETGLS